MGSVETRFGVNWAKKKCGESTPGRRQSRKQVHRSCNRFAGMARNGCSPGGRQGVLIERIYTSSGRRRSSRRRNTLPSNWASAKMGLLLHAEHPPPQHPRPSQIKETKRILIGKSKAAWRRIDKRWRVATQFVVGPEVDWDPTLGRRRSMKNAYGLTPRGAKPGFRRVGARFPCIGGRRRKKRQVGEGDDTTFLVSPILKEDDCPGPSIRRSIRSPGPRCRWRSRSNRPPGRRMWEGDESAFFSPPRKTATPVLTAHLGNSRPRLSSGAKARRFYRQHRTQDNPLIHQGHYWLAQGDSRGPAVPTYMSCNQIFSVFSFQPRRKSKYSTNKQTTPVPPHNLQQKPNGWSVRPAAGISDNTDGKSSG